MISRRTTNFCYTLLILGWVCTVILYGTKINLKPLIHLQIRFEPEFQQLNISITPNNYPRFFHPFGNRQLITVPDRPTDLHVPTK